MDWVAEALRLKKDPERELTWNQIAEEIQELTGENYHPEKVRAACRRRIESLNEGKSDEKEGEEENLPLITEEDGIYTVTQKNKKTDPIYISKNTIKKLKKMYCIKPWATMNECARKLNIPRNDLYVILKAFKITHTDVPFIEEDLVSKDPEELAKESFEYSKQRYVETFDRIEPQLLRQELQKYQRQDYFIDKLHEIVSESIQNFSTSYNGPSLSNICIDGNFMLEVSIFDLHLGKLAWGPETGEGNYDYKIAREGFFNVVYEKYERAKNQKDIEKILFVVGNDYLTFDTILSTTTEGTPQDTDLRWMKLFSIGVEMLIESIDLFSSIAPVDVIVVPGNHDKMSSFYIQKCLWAWYNNNEAVNISQDIKTRKYAEYGKSLIGFSHGNKEKKRIHHLMPLEQPAAWARTKYHEMHLGHYHHEKTVEPNGIITRNLSSISGTDAWHFEQGFIGATKKAQSFLWHKDKGLYSIWHVNM